MEKTKIRSLLHAKHKNKKQNSKIFRRGRTERKEEGKTKEEKRKLKKQATEQHIQKNVPRCMCAHICIKI